MNSPAKRITVLLADDYRTVREGLRALLVSEGDIEVIGEAKDGRQAVELTRTLHPDVVIMDLSMPKLNGLEATRQIRDAFASVRVLILSVHQDDRYIKRSAEVGAAGYLLKQTSLELLPRAIREVHQGHTFYDSAATQYFQRKPKREGHRSAKNPQRQHPAPNPK